MFENISTKNKNIVKKKIGEYLNISQKEINIQDYEILTFKTSSSIWRKCQLFHSNNMLENNFGFSCDLNVFIPKYIWEIDLLRIK